MTVISCSPAQDPSHATQFSVPSSRIVSIAALLAALASCTSAPVHSSGHTGEQSGAVEWGYEGNIGPEHWGDLSPAYAMAKNGREQSPIDISGAAPQELQAIPFSYVPATVNVIYNGHTIEEVGDGRSSIQVDGKDFVLKQYHFHAPSEHTVNGRHADVEMHLVHESAEGTHAVVGVMIKSRAENAGFAPIWKDLPDAQHPTRIATDIVDVDRMLPEDRSYYRYLGSFTTPPCTEGVRWYVLEDTRSVSEEQVSSFVDLIGEDARGPQPLNARLVLH